MTAGYRRRPGEELTGNQYEVLRRYAAGEAPEAIVEALHRVGLAEVERTIARLAGGNRRRASLLVVREEQAAAHRSAPRRGGRRS